MALRALPSLHRPFGVTAVGLLFLFGVFASGLSVISLLTPGGVLEPVWRLNPHARVVFSQLGMWAPLLLSLVCVSCAAASFGFFTGRKWGYRLGIAMLVLNLAGDLVNGLSGIEPRALVGVPIAGLLLWYLSSGKVKAFFRVAALRAA